MAEKLCPLMHGPVLQRPQSSDGSQPCIEHRCRWYIQLLGKHPQTGEPVPEWGCAVEFIPILLIENAQQVRHYAAAVESARNVAQVDAAAVTAAVVQAAEAMRSGAARPVSAEDLHAELRERHGRAVAGPGLLERLRLAFRGGA